MLELEVQVNYLQAGSTKTREPTTTPNFPRLTLN